jgi:hypothetical protein
MWRRAKYCSSRAAADRVEDADADELLIPLRERWWEEDDDERRCFDRFEEDERVGDPLAVEVVLNKAVPVAVTVVDDDERRGDGPEVVACCSAAAAAVT